MDLVRIFNILSVLLFSIALRAESIDDQSKENLYKTVEHFILSSSAEDLDWNWEEAIGLHGLDQVSDYLPLDLRIRSGVFIKKYHDYWHKKQPKISWADEIPSVLSVMNINEDQLKSEQSNFSRSIKYLKEAELNEIGSIDHLGEKSFVGKIFKPYKNSIWLDSLMMWGNLSLRAGLEMKDQKLVDLALSQPEIFSKYLQDEGGMFIHSYNYKGGYSFPRKKLFWTRGNSWVVATLADYLSLMPKDDHRYQKIKNIFEKITKAFFKARKKNGLWVNLYPYNKDNRIDTSGSALVAYGMAKGNRIGVLGREYLVVARNIFKEVNKRLETTDYGKKLTKVIGPTVPGPRLFYRVIPYQRNSHFGHGAYFLLASEILR